MEMETIVTCLWAVADQLGHKEGGGDDNISQNEAQSFVSVWLLFLGEKEISVTHFSKQVMTVRKYDIKKLESFQMKLTLGFV